jgi:hypothetical protein
MYSVSFSSRPRPLQPIPRVKLDDAAPWRTTATSAISRNQSSVARLSGCAKNKYRSSIQRSARRLSSSSMSFSSLPVSSVRSCRRICGLARVSNDAMHGDYVVFLGDLKPDLLPKLRLAVPWMAGDDRECARRQQNLAFPFAKAGPPQRQRRRLRHFAEPVDSLDRPAQGAVADQIAQRSDRPRSEIVGVLRPLRPVHKPEPGGAQQPHHIGP